MPRTPDGLGDEAQLAEGVRHGDPGAFEVLLRTYGGRLTTTARHLLGDEEAARLAVHDAVRAAFAARGELRQDVRLSTWLHRHAVTAALARMRADDVDRPDEEPIEDLLPRFLPTGVHVETFERWSDAPVPDTLTAAERQAVRDAILRLPSAYRTVLLLRDVEGVTADEAADILGIPANAVRIRLHRARMALRTLIAPQFREATA